VAKLRDSERNRCRACGNTWFPAGVERALSCPRCGSEDVALSWIERWPAYAGCLAVAAFLLAVLFSLVKLGMAWLPRHGS